MRSTDEQLSEIMKRAVNVKEKRAIRNRLCACAIATAACVLLLLVTMIYMPHFSSESDSVSGQYGSLLLAAPQMGYVLVAFLAFAMGICFTFLCINWKALNKREHEQK